jgi:RNA polymerase sigma factor (sigma-70 family)
VLTEEAREGQQMSLTARETVSVSALPLEVALTATAMLETLAREQRIHAMWLCRRFRVLSYEDAEDLVAEALSRVDGDLPTHPPAARAYLHQMLYRDAIDEIRHRQGRRPTERAARPQVVPLVKVPSSSGPVSDQTADGELERRATRSVRQAAVQRALAALPEQERETVRMRYLDGLEPEAICRGLRLTRTQYERRLTDGIRHALDALVAEAPLPACQLVRAKIAAAPGRLQGEDAARRDAHLEECLSCRAFERRARGLLGLLPTGQALGWWAQLRLKGEGWLHRGAEVASGASAGDAGAAAAASGGAGAAGGLSVGGILAGGAAVKVAAACSGAAIAVACVVQVPPLRERPERTSDKARTDRAAIERPGTGNTPRPARTATVIATPTATPTPVTHERATATAERSRVSGEGTRTAATSRRRERARAASTEFGPDAAGEPVTDPAQATTVGASAATAQSSAGAEPEPTSGGTATAGHQGTARASSPAREFAP